MTIRRLLYALFGLFALLLAGAGLWQLSDSRSKASAVEWIHMTNRIADVAQQASAALAMERGATAAVLAHEAGPASPLYEEMLRTRAAAESVHASLTELADALARFDPDHPLFDHLREMQGDHRMLLNYRERVDQQLSGGAKGLTVEHWMALMVGYIEQLQELVGVSMLPWNDNIYTHASLPIIKDVLFSLGEYLGRERAMIGAAIARGAPLSEAELASLNDYRVVTLWARRRAESMLVHLPPTTELARARQEFEQALLHRYETLRAAVYAASRNGVAYPVDSQKWYREATAGIDAVVGLSQVIGSQFDLGMDRLRDHASKTRGLLALAFVVLTLLFVLAAHMLRRRVLRPLGVLEQAARTMSSGDLTRPLPRLADDEFGRLGRVFEQMRTALLEDAYRREHDARELRKLNALIQHSASAMIVTDADGIIEYTNARFRTMTGYGNEEAIGRKAGFWQSGMTSQDEYRELWSAARGGRVWEGELINRRKNGEMYWASVTVSPVFGEQGEITHYIGIQNDISARRRIEERLSFLSSFDELTRLPNAASLSRSFVQARVAAAFSGAQIGLVSLGISHFKRINDSMGRDVGDQLLREIAQRLNSCALAHDTVARVGGTEFTLLVTNATDLAEIQERVEHVIETTNLPLVIQGERLKPCVKAGVSLMSGNGDSLEAMLRKASVALHHAEQRGMNCCFYSDVLDRDALERLSLENALRQALENNKLELHYQPKVDIASGRVVGVEALARWFDPGGGEYVSPARFIPVAEESGLIAYLGAWALREACRQNRAWQLAGLPPMVVAVNLSAVQLRQADLVDIVVEVLKDSELDPCWLELELTESALMEDPDQANRVLARLKALGLRLAIDDFGTGYSSLSYLSRFPVDQLKIDRGFVSSITTDRNAAAISTSVVALAHQLDLKVIAEGVESAEQLDFLARHGCDEIQGYYCSPPVPARQLQALVAGGKLLFDGRAASKGQERPGAAPLDGDFTIP